MVFVKPEIYTTYFSALKNINMNDYYIFKICRKYINADNVISWPQLFPTAEMVEKMKSGEMTEKEYTSLYFKKLSRIHPATMITQMKGYAAGGILSSYGNDWEKQPDFTDWVEKPFLLVCLETPEKFCHRHLIAEWLKANDYKVEELKVSSNNGISLEDTSDNIITDYFSGGLEI